MGYLVHLDRSYKHARLVAEVNQAGIPWRVAAAWDGDRALERRLKRPKNAPRLRPVCRSKGVRP